MKVRSIHFFVSHEDKPSWIALLNRFFFGISIQAQREIILEIILKTLKSCENSFVKEDQWKTQWIYQKWVTKYDSFEGWKWRPKGRK